MGHRIHITVCLQRGVRMESYFRRVTLRRAPRCSRDAQGPCGWTRSTGQARMQLKAITREDCVDAYCGCSFFFVFGCMDIV